MENTVRWSLIVSKETDISLRTYLAHLGARKGDLSKFVEEAVRWRVLDKVVQEVKSRNAKASPENLESAIDEAVRSVRADRSWNDTVHLEKSGSKEKQPFMRFAGASSGPADSSNPRGFSRP